MAFARPKRTLFDMRETRSETRDDGRIALRRMVRVVRHRALRWFQPPIAVVVRDRLEATQSRLRLVSSATSAANHRRGPTA